MQTSWIISTTFLIIISAEYFLKLSHNYSTYWITRIALVTIFCAALFFEFRKSRKTISTNPEKSRNNFTKQKITAIRLLLFILLISSFTFEKLINWPSGVFNYDYFFIFPILVLLTPQYVRYVESISPSGQDDYFRLGDMILGNNHFSISKIKPLLLSWLVKIFFIPLMYSWLVTTMEFMFAFPWEKNPATIISALFFFGVCIDLLIGSGGYLFSSRIFGNETKSTDNSISGWMVCLICYPPFNILLHAAKEQTDNKIWTDWLNTDEPLYWIWAILITSTWIVYWLSTVSFGLRFSNLSWRGLVDSGPYRISKHPAYLSKNIYWWLHTVPFFGVFSKIDMLRNIIGLSFVSLIYYLRAKTEEKHLMQFAEYRNYHEKMKEKSISLKLLKIIKGKNKKQS